MELLLFVENLRSAYVQEFVLTFEQEAAQPGEFFAEITFKISGGVYKQLYVADFVRRVGNSNRVVEIGPTPLTMRGPASFVQDRKEVIFDVVSWDAVEVTTTPPFKISADFAKWFDRWLDSEKARQDGEVVTGIIHSVTFVDGGLQVDFGTAPADAAIELIGLLQNNGAETIHFGNARE